MKRRASFHPGTVERAVIGSVRHAEWVEDEDQAAVWGARLTARQIDNADRQGRLEGIAQGGDPVMAELARTLLAYLRDLGLTPGARRRLGIGEAADDGLSATITRLRQAAAGDSPD